MPEKDVDLYACWSKADEHKKEDTNNPEDKEAVCTVHNEKNVKPTEPPTEPTEPTDFTIRPWH